jgi:hypothetical protein
VGTAVFAAGLFWLQASALRWEAERPAVCMPDACFCEAVRAAPIRQPSNTWSCLAYALAGFLILEKRLRRPLGPRAANAAAFASLELFLAVTSAYFHAALTFRAEWYDVLVLYLVPGYLAAFNLWRTFGVARAAAALAIIAVASGLFLAVTSVGRMPAFIALMAFFLATQWRIGRGPETDYRWLLRAVGTFGVALTIWVLDKSHVVCAPLSPWQGHAVWHVLCAGVVGLLFLHCDAMCQRPGGSQDDPDYWVVGPKNSIIAESDAAFART